LKVINNNGANVQSIHEFLPVACNKHVFIVQNAPLVRHYHSFNVWIRIEIKCYIKLIVCLKRKLFLSQSIGLQLQDKRTKKPEVSKPEVDIQSTW